MFDIISDLHKDARGFRPTSDWMIMFESQSEEMQQEIFDGLVEEMKESQEEEARLEQKAIYDFDDQVAAVRRNGAPDRATALRWITQTETFYNEQCVEHWVWNQGFLFTDYGRALVKELMTIVEFKEWEAA